MKELFQIAGGSIMGRMHAQPLRYVNNQDAFGWRSDSNSLVALVTDGCGSGPKSEVGANIGCQLVLSELKELAVNLTGQIDLRTGNFILKIVRLRVLQKIKDLALGMGDDFLQIINDYFLFSIMGVIITEKVTLIFSLGDGIYYLNEEKNQIGPFPKNAPPYLCYGLLKSSSALSSEFEIQRILPTDSVASILIGTDGVVDFADKPQELLPGKNEVLGTVSQFWENDKYFLNPDMIRRRLALANNETVENRWKEQCSVKHAGLLPDDTTLVVIRRTTRKE